MPATKLKPKTAAPSKSRPAAKKSKPTAAKKKPAPPPAKKGGASKAKAASATKAKATSAKKAKPAGVSKSKGAGAVKSGTGTKRAAAGKTAAKKAAGKPAGKAAAKKQAKDVLDFSEFPAGSVTRHDVSLCLACIFKLFTNQLGLAPRTAYNEIRRYAPTVAELTAREPQRPFFKATDEKSSHCPYCEAPKRWHAGLSVYRVEGGKYGDAARRALLKRLPTKDEQFQIHEERRTARQVFFEWLERLGQTLDLDTDAVWMPTAAREYLQRREPKTDWGAAFDGVRAVRRSQRITEGFERDGARLFLAPALYNDVLLVQYLVSRSHRHGGRTFEGRLTLPELVRRMRYGGHLEAQGITDRDRFDVLEQLVENLTGGDAPARLHFITDRRGLLDRAKEVYDRQTA
jgi:hypothetical protein